jgi:hypothetical protein
MSSKRGVRRKACGDKRRFATEDDAVPAAKALGISWYHCRWCGAWHIGHMPKRIKQGIAARRGRSNT